MSTDADDLFVSRTTNMQPNIGIVNTVKSLSKYTLQTGTLIFELFWRQIIGFYIESIFIYYKT